MLENINLCFVLLQGGHIKMHLHSDLPVQVDGEPWVQCSGDIVVLKSALRVSYFPFFYLTFILLKLFFFLWKKSFINACFCMSFFPIHGKLTKKLKTKLTF